MIEFEILKLELRTNMGDMFKMSSDTSSFDETPEASTLYPNPLFFRER
jgi:hypothetical protein